MARSLPVILRFLALASACGALLYGQTFEVATVKPASKFLPDGRMVVGMLPAAGGPGTDDPGRIRYPVISLKALLLQAYDAAEPDIRAPGWLDDEFFEINAILPPGTTKEQLRAMLRNLLNERFRLTMHREAKPTAGYALELGRAGLHPKTIRTSGADGALVDKKWAPRKGSDGFVVPQRRPGLFVENGSGRSRWTFQQTSMDSLAGSLGFLLGKPVTNATDLPGKYDFSLTFRTEGTIFEKGPSAGVPWPEPEAGARPTAAAEPYPDLFGAVELLGLRLERKKAGAETIVIDHIEKRPTDN